MQGSRRPKMTLKFLGAGAALALACIALAIASAQADVIYTYTGNDFTTVFNNNPPPAPQYTTMDSVSGNFTLSTPLAANRPLTAIPTTDILAFTFTDGVQTLTNTTPGLQPPMIGIGTDIAGNPNVWDIDLSATDLSTFRYIIESFNLPTSIFDQGFTFVLTINNNSNTGEILNDPGAWTVTTTTVAEPGSAWLLAAGLAFLFWRQRPAAMALVRRRQRLFEPVAS
jgi:hypothetical protein